MISSIYKGYLKSGLSYYIHNTNIGDNIIHIELTVKAGSMADGDKKGMAHLLEHCNMNFVKYQFHQDFRYKASAHTDYYYTRYIFTIKKENIKNIFNILQNLLLGYYLIPKYFSEVKQDIMNEYEKKEKNKNYQALKQLLKNTIYEDNIPIGNMKIVNGIFFEEMKLFFETWYMPENSAIIVVGNVNKDYIINEINKISFLSKINITKTEIIETYKKNTISIDKENLINNNGTYYFYYLLNRKENISNKKYIEDNFAYDFTLDILEAFLKNDDVYTICKNGCQRSVFSCRYELLYLSLKYNKNVILDDIRKDIFVNAKCFLKDNFRSTRDEYIYMLKNIEQHLTITNMLNHCMESFVFGINLVSNLEEIEIAMEFLMNLDENQIEDCLKKIIMESTVICI